jgi:hypothetical protein
MRVGRTALRKMLTLFSKSRSSATTRRFLSSTNEAKRSQTHSHPVEPRRCPRLGGPIGGQSLPLSPTETTHVESSPTPSHGFPTTRSSGEPLVPLNPLDTVLP